MEVSEIYSERIMASKIRTLEREVQKLAAQRDALLAALEAVEWIPEDDPNFVYCPWCEVLRFKHHRLEHKANCQRQVALARAERVRPK